MANTFTIACKKHAVSEPILACTHIANAHANQHHKDIFVVPADAENETQAWCETCEDARMTDQGWYDAADAVAKWSFICSNCYAEKTGNVDEIVTYEDEVTPDEKPE